MADGEPEKCNTIQDGGTTENIRICRSQRGQVEAYRGPGYHPGTWVVVTACGL